MIKKTQTIVTEDQLEQKIQEHAVPTNKPFTVINAQVSTGQTPAVQGGFPSEQYPKASDAALKEIGSAEAKKEQSQKFDLNNAKFDNLIKKNASRTLLKIKTAKLFDFFPDEITIDTTKINVSLRDYFFMRRLHTISIEDVSDVFVETTPFYASLKIVDKDFIENIVEIQFLRKNDAKKARRIIQGLVAAYKENVDLTSLPEDGLIAKLEILGSAGDIESIKR